MAGNGTFYQKSTTQNRKTLITQPKHVWIKQKVFESLWSDFVIPEKKKKFCLGVAHGDPIIVEIGSKNGNF